MIRSRLLKLVVAPFVLPHEPAVLTGLPTNITLLPDWEGNQQPLGRFNADLDSSTPLWLIRVTALAPIPLFVGLAVLLRLTVLPTGSVAISVFLLCSYWAAPSGGDLAIARRPMQARTAGEFLATTTSREMVISDVATVGIGVLVAVVVLA
jgi:hypothetical protein